MVRALNCALLTQSPRFLKMDRELQRTSRDGGKEPGSGECVNQMPVALLIKQIALKYVPPNSSNLLSSETCGYTLFLCTFNNLRLFPSSKQCLKILLLNFKSYIRS